LKPSYATLSLHPGHLDGTGCTVYLDPVIQLRLIEDRSSALQ